MSTGWDGNEVILNYRQRSFNLTVQKSLIFLSLKLSLQSRVFFFVLLHLNDLATISALTGTSYAPVRKINMFADIGVIVRGWLLKSPDCFQPRTRNFKTGQNTHFWKVYFRKKSSSLFGAKKIAKTSLWKNWSPKNTDLQLFFETEMLSAFYPCEIKR